jgi:site-specific recombinase XerD
VDEWTFAMASEFRSGWKVGLCSTRGYQSVLRKFFRFCILADWMIDNPVEKLDWPRGPRVKGNRPHPPEEVEALLTEAVKPWRFEIYGREYNQDYLYAMVVVLRYVGLRHSDTVALNESSIDVAGKVITVLPIKTRKKNKKAKIPAHPSFAKPWRL